MLSWRPIWKSKVFYFCSPGSNICELRDTFVLCNGNSWWEFLFCMKKSHTLSKKLDCRFLTNEIYFGLITSYWVKVIHKCQEGVTDLEKNLVINKFEIYVYSKTESDNLNIMHPIVITTSFNFFLCLLFSICNHFLGGLLGTLFNAINHRLCIFRMRYNVWLSSLVNIFFAWVT